MLVDANTARLAQGVDQVVREQKTTRLAHTAIFADVRRDRLSTREGVPERRV
jgi:hypothetical protein